MTYSPVLGPVVALVAWTMFMWFWMYAVRIPAMQRAGMLDERVGSAPGHLDNVLEPKAQWKAHNYNHLMEQPTLFYVVAIGLALMGDQDPTTAKFAWAYVGLRVAHSLVQSTVNIVKYRSALFALGSGVLILLSIRLIALAVRSSG
jgi:hypothetical protein